MTAKTGIKRTRSGCWTCRKRGYRCDEERPICCACQRLNIECQGYGIRLTWMQSASRSKKRVSRNARRTTPTNVARRSEPPRDCLPTPDWVRQALQREEYPLFATPSSSLSSKDLFLLQHYFYTVANLLSSSHDRSVNTYRMVILPMAMSSEMLLNAILLVSTAHLSSRYEHVALDLPQYRQRVLPSLIDRINSWQRFEATTLATIIMLSINEVFEANPDTWSRHLKAAGRIIADYTSQCMKPDQDVKMLLDIFAYHNVLASVGTDHTSLVMDYYYITETWSAFAGKNVAFLSCVDRLLSLVAKLSVLSSSACVECPAPSSSSLNVNLTGIDRLGLPPLCASHPSSKRKSHRTITAAHLPSALALKADLERWEPPLAAVSDDARNTAEAMRSAGLLFYYQLTSQHRSTQDVAGIANAYRSVIRHIDIVPPDSPAAASHLWPLYMAGCFLLPNKPSTAKSCDGTRSPQGIDESTLSLRDAIRTRLTALKAKRGLRTVDRVAERLDKIWSRDVDDVEASWNELTDPLILI